MEGEQRDPKNTTKNLFAGLTANENDQQQNNGAGKRRRVSFGRRITYFQPSSGAQSSTSSYVRMTSPVPNPSPLPPEFFDETHMIFDQLDAQTAVEATRTIRKETENAICNEDGGETRIIFDQFQQAQTAMEATRTIRKETATSNDSDADESPPSPAVNVDATHTLGEHIIFGDNDNATHIAFDRFQQQPNSPAMVGATQTLRNDTGGYGNKENYSDGLFSDRSVPMESMDMEVDLNALSLPEEVLALTLTAQYDNDPAKVDKFIEEEDTDDGQLQDKEEEETDYGQQDKEETDDNIDISSIPGDELLAQTEREYYAALRGYTQEKKLFHDLQNKKMELIERLKDRQQKMRERNRAFWANMEHDVKKVLREVQKFDGRDEGVNK